MSVEIAQNLFFWGVAKRLAKTEGLHEDRADILLKLQGRAFAGDVEILKSEPTSLGLDVALFQQLHELSEPEKEVEGRVTWIKLRRFYSHTRNGILPLESSRGACTGCLITRENRSQTGELIARNSLIVVIELIIYRVSRLTCPNWFEYWSV